ncbi:protein Mis18-alpha [Pholidichthys leucotaenia]
MASTETSSTRRDEHWNKTIELSSLDSTVVEERLFGSGEEKHGSDDDGPVVFFCTQCKLTVGDSLSWDGTEEDLNQIKLKRVTDNVIKGKETRLFEPSKQSPCLIVDLICRGCQSVIGMLYTSTPKDLDHKRFTFYFNVASIESYVLGSASQVCAAEGAKEQLVTLEYRCIVEEQLTEMKMLVMSMAHRLEEIEGSLRD